MGSKYDNSDNDNRNTSKVSRNSMLLPETLLWKFHDIILNAFARIPVTDYCKENYDQFAMYFELMRVVRGGNELVYRVLGRVPRTTGPCATIPSRLHSTTIHAMLARLNSEKIYQKRTQPGNYQAMETRRSIESYSVVNEFVGLYGVMPVDAAVYYENIPVALVEIDGEFHYKSLGQQLRRKDVFKEHLYRVRPPLLICLFSPLYAFIRCLYSLII